MFVNKQQNISELSELSGQKVADSTLYFKQYDKANNSNTNVKIDSPHPPPNVFDHKINYTPNIQDSYIPNPDYSGCAKGFFKKACLNGHFFAHTVYCGKEYCLTCGKQGSQLHNRRVARWADKVQLWQNCMYIVVTMPQELRPGFTNRKNIRDYYTFIKRKLQRLGYNKGFARWHWAGDCPYCKGTGTKNGKECEYCHGTGVGNVFKPHLNILIDCNFMKPENIDLLKKDCARWLTKKFKIKIPEKIDIKLIPAHEPGQRTHKVKYITRSTWFDKNNIQIIELIDNLRNAQTWGKQKIERPEKEKTEKLCPCCGAQMTGDIEHCYTNEILQNYKLVSEIKPGVWLIELVPLEVNGSNSRQFERYIRNKYFNNTS